MAIKPRLTPRKEPSQERSRDTVEAMLEATRRLLASGGFEALNTNEVAEVAGVSVGSLYQYFPSKESLVTAALGAHLRRIRDGLMDGLAQCAAADGEDWARSVVSVFVAAFEGPAWLVEASLREREMKAGRKLDPIRQECEEVLDAFFAHRGWNEHDAARGLAMVEGTLMVLATRGAEIDASLVVPLTRALQTVVLP